MQKKYAKYFFLCKLFEQSPYIFLPIFWVVRFCWDARCYHRRYVHPLLQEVAHLAHLLIFTLVFDENRLEHYVAASPLAFWKGGGVSCKCVCYWHFWPLEGVARSSPPYGSNERTCEEEAGTLASVCHIIIDTFSNL